LFQYIATFGRPAAGVEWEKLEWKVVDTLSKYTTLATAIANPNFHF
jgi:hypothetical protein